MALFQQLMGECSTKEWIAKLSDKWTDAGEPLWVLIQIWKNPEDPTFEVNVFASTTDIDWLSNPIPLELLVEQEFTHRGAVWSLEGENPLELLFKARDYVEYAF